MLSLRLFVAGDGPNSQKARANLRDTLQRLDLRADVDVVDVFDQPELALKHAVYVTPTLVRITPPPTLRLIGSLHDQELLVAFLQEGS